MVLTILDKLRDNEKKIEKEYYILEKHLQRVFGILFEEPIMPLFDWLFRITENPELASVLGMPSTGEITMQIRPLLASDSGFAEAMRTQVAHRLYSIFQVLLWFENNPLCPDWLISYKNKIKMIYNLIKRKYLSIEKIDSSTMKKAWRFSSEETWIAWDRFHDVASLDVSYLFPTLQYLNNPGIFRREMDIFRLNTINRNILKKFNQALLIDINKKVDVFVDFSKLVWCIDTFLINSAIAQKAEFRSSLRLLTTELIERSKQDIEVICKPNRNFVIKMPAPEIYTAERTLLFSAAWSLEVDLLISKLYKNTSLKWLSAEFKNAIRKIALKGVEHILFEDPRLTSTTNPTHFHLYSLCQRFWFLLECWHYRTICAAIELRRAQKKATWCYRPVQKKPYYYYKSFWQHRIEKNLFSFADVKRKIINRKELPGTLYSIFILGGSGIGKTFFVKNILRELLGIESEPIRCTPIDIRNTDALYGIINSISNEYKVFFLDEIHLKNKFSPYMLMLDPLQENCIHLKDIGKKIIYVFASSAYRDREEFYQVAQKYHDIPMRDFATRIMFWLELPDLWQLPEQKFVLGYAQAQTNSDNKKREKASLVTIDSSLGDVRAIEQAINGNTRKLKKTATQYIRGDILKLFDSKGI